MVPVVNELSTHLLCTGNEFVAMPETCVCDDIGNSFKIEFILSTCRFRGRLQKEITTTNMFMKVACDHMCRCVQEVVKHIRVDTYVVHKTDIVYTIDACDYT